MRKYETLIFDGLLLLVTSCDKERCSGEVICDDYMYVMIELQVIDETDTPVELDRAIVKRFNDGVEEVFEPEFDSLHGSGSYTIATDSDIDNVPFDGAPFQFLGWLDAELVVEEDFLIGRDCCHIKKLEGPDKLVID